MIAISWYILKVLIVSGILTGYYYLALKDKVFHRWNRFYLLMTVCFSFILPLVKINIFTNTAEKGNIAKALQTITMQDEIVIEMGRKGVLSTNMLITYGYLLVSLFLIATLISTLIKIRRIKRRYPQTTVHGVNFINTHEKGTPFSFFNSIFWNQSIDLHSSPGQQIFNHEIAHVKEKHTHDKIFLNVVLLFFWINPFFWIIRKELNMIHEFIADKMALEDGDTNAFAEMILSSAYPGQQFSITNNFFYSPIKRRLMMLTKNKLAKVNYISRLLVLPLASIVFIGVSCKVKTETESQKAPNEIAATAPSNEGTEAAEKANITLTQPPIGAIYNGKRIMYAVKSKGNNVTLRYPDGSNETITLDQAKKANLQVMNPTKEKVQFTPPKVVSNEEANKSPKEKVQFTPPKVIKNENNETQNSAKSTPANNLDRVFTKVEEEAQFPGGPAKWAQYMQRSIAAQINKFDDQDFGTCVLKFIVDKDGNVSDVAATTMKDTHLAQVSIDAIRKGPKWIPAMQNNQPVNAYRLQPVTLTNPDPDK